MKPLLILLLFFITVQSNGQTKKKSKLDGSLKGKVATSGTTPFFVDTSKAKWFINEQPISYAYLPNNSDTLIMMDTVLNLYGHIIRYIKIGGKVYPLKP